MTLNSRQSPPAGGLLRQVFRLTVEQMWWLQQEASRLGGTANKVVRFVLDDARTLFGLPEPVVEDLALDARRQGLDFDSYLGRREYLLRLCTLRYKALGSGGSGGEGRS